MAAVDVRVCSPALNNQEYIFKFMRMITNMKSLLKMRVKAKQSQTNRPPDKSMTMSQKSHAYVARNPPANQKQVNKSMM